MNCMLLCNKYKNPICWLEHSRKTIPLLQPRVAHLHMLELFISNVFCLLREIFSAKLVKVVLLIGVLWVICTIKICDFNEYLSSCSLNKTEHRLLALTPMGSSVEEVKSVIRARGWQLFYEKHFQQNWHTEIEYPGVSGSCAIGALLEKHFEFPFSRETTCYWGFDKTGKLCDQKIEVFAIGL